MALFTTPGASLGGIPGSAALARLLVVISGNSQGLSAALGQATSDLSKFHGTANQLGNTITRSITLPTLALGGIVVKVAGDFEAAMARVAGITSLTGEQADKAREQILGLVASEDIIAGPTELADSLYFAGSAGLEFAKAMQVVELSAKGSSVGMGDASDIARVLISSLNAFEEQGLTAAEAMDALTAAIKVGTAEPDELAIALGRLLPIAAEVGLTFQETVAQVAALTNIGVPTRVATTALRALFNQFLAPTQLARENLDALGISYDKLQNAIKAGPLVAFELLTTAAKGNDEIIRDLIPQVRALTAFLGLSDEKADNSAEALNAVRNSAGSLDKVLDEFRDTPFFRFQNAVNELQLAAIDFGAVVIPIFNQLVSVLGDLGAGLQALPDPLKGVAVGFLAIVAAAGPALKLFGSLMTNTGIFVGGLQGVAKAFGVLAVSATLAVGALNGFASGQGTLLSFIVGAVSAFAALSTGLGLLRRAADAGALGVNSVSFAIAGLSGLGIAAIAGGLTLIIAAFVAMQRAAGRVTRETRDFGTALKDAAAGGETFQQFFKRLRENVDADIANRIVAIAKAAGLLGKVQVVDNFDDLTKAIGTDLVAALEAASKAQTGFFPDELRRAIPIFRRATAAGRDLGPVLKDAGISSDEFNDALQRFSTSGATGETDKLGEEVDVLAKAYANAIQAQKDFRVEQAARIRAVNLEEDAVRAMAQEEGVSYDFLKGKLDEYGVAAKDLFGDNKQLFLEEAGFREASTGRQIGALNELKAAEAEALADRQESLRGTVEFLTEIENISKATTKKIITDSNKVADSFINFARNTRTLLRRGVDPGALQALVDQGPATVARFVDLSDQELKRWETNFSIAMAAGDAVVLNEGKHLQTKGNAMIANFTEAILGNKNLPVGAMQQIVNGIRERLIAGDLRPSALTMISNFADALGRSRNIPNEEVAGIVLALADKLGDKPKFRNAGRKVIVEWALGIAENAGLSRAQGLAIANLFIGELEQEERARNRGKNAVVSYAEGAHQQTGLAKSAGVDIGNKFTEGLSIVDLFSFGQSVIRRFVNGILSMGSAVNSAVAKVTGDIQHGFGQGLEGSPQLFTYYLGQDLIDQMNEGIRSRTPTRIMKPVVLSNAPAATSSQTATSGDGETRHRYHHDRRGVVKLDSYQIGKAERMNYLRRADRV